MYTTAEQVAEIVELDATISLTPFITVAEELVSELCLDSGYSTDRLTLIATWLTAHFYCVRDPRATSESVSGAMSQSYQLWTGQNLQSTEFGQTALSLDTKGNLLKLNNQLNNNKGKQPCGITTLMTDDDRDYYGVE
jgi:hypothetical protein